MSHVIMLLCGFQVSGIFNIYSKASSYMDIRRKFAAYSGFKFLTYSLHIQYMLVLLLPICNEYVRDLKPEYVANFRRISM